MYCIYQFSMGRPRKTEEEKRANRSAYSKKNYHKVRARREEKIRCECGAMVSRAYIADHRKKQKHLHALEFVNSLKQEHNVCQPVTPEVKKEVN